MKRQHAAAAKGAIFPVSFVYRVSISINRKRKKERERERQEERERERGGA